jgi:hypothetical protein
VRATLLMPLAVWLATADAGAQTAITWFTLDGGGGTSSNGAFAVTGTVGQADAAVSVGGNFTVRGGFWSAWAVVPVEDAPPLRIFRLGDDAILAWPHPSTGFQLQESPGLTPTAWTNVNLAPVLVEGEWRVSQPLTPAMKYFRLHKP